MGKRQGHIGKVPTPVLLSLAHSTAELFSKEQDSRDTKIRYLIQKLNQLTLPSLRMGGWQRAPELSI